MLKELRLLSSLVSLGQALVVCDTIVQEILSVNRRQRPRSPQDNLDTALEVFLDMSQSFERNTRVNGKLITSFSPGGYLQGVK